MLGESGKSFRAMPSNQSANGVMVMMIRAKQYVGLIALLLAVSVADAQPITYIEAEKYASPATAGSELPLSEGATTYTGGTAVSRGAAAVVEPGGQLVYHLAPEAASGIYQVWVRIWSDRANRNLAASLGTRDEMHSIGVVRGWPLHYQWGWMPLQRAGAIATVMIRDSQTHLLRLEAIGTDEATVDAIALVSAGHKQRPPNVAPVRGFNPQLSLALENPQANAEQATQQLSRQMSRFAEIPDEAVLVAAYLQRQGVQLFTTVGEGNFSLIFNLAVAPGLQAEVRPEDKLVFRLRELITDKITTVVKPIGVAVSSGDAKSLSVTITDAEADLPAGPYHVAIYLTRKGQPINQGLCGSEEFYVKVPGESKLHIQGVMATGRLRYFKDYENPRWINTGSAYWIPAIYDPFNPDTWVNFLDYFGSDTSSFLELIEAGCSGILEAAKAYRTTGEIERARFCERGLQDYCDFVIDQTIKEDGSMWACRDPLEEKYEILKGRGHGNRRWVWIPWLPYTSATVGGRWVTSPPRAAATFTMVTRTYSTAYCPAGS